MGDESAAGTIRAATAVHIQEMYAALPDDHDMRFDGLVDVGRVLGLTDTAYENAAIGAAEDRLAAANDAAGRINTEIGLIPGIGNAYSAYTLTVPSNLTLGSLVTHPDQAAVDAATQQAIDDAIRRNGNPLGVIVVTEHDARLIQAGGDDIEDAAKDRR